MPTRSVATKAVKELSCNTKNKDTAKVPMLTPIHMNTVKDNNLKKSPTLQYGVKFPPIQFLQPPPTGAHQHSHVCYQIIFRSSAIYSVPTQYHLQHKNIIMFTEKTTTTIHFRKINVYP